jgi:hypothetical protein
MSVKDDIRKPDRATVLHLDQLLDEALEETFPASDPVAVAVAAKSNPPRLEAGFTPRARESMNPRQL